MNLWKIWDVGNDNLPALHIYAKSFDEALYYARLVNPSYQTGQVEED